MCWKGGCWAFSKMLSKRGCRRWWAEQIHYWVERLQHTNGNLITSWRMKELAHCTVYGLSAPTFFFLNLKEWKGVKSQNATVGWHCGAAYLAPKANSHWKPGIRAAVPELWLTTGFVLWGWSRAGSLWPAGQWFKTQTDFVNTKKEIPPEGCLLKWNTQESPHCSPPAACQPSVARLSELCAIQGRRTCSQRSLGVTKPIILEPQSQDNLLKAA